MLWRSPYFLALIIVLAALVSGCSKYQEKAQVPNDAQLAHAVDAGQPVPQIMEGPGRALGDGHRESPTPPVTGRGIQLANGYTTGTDARKFETSAVDRAAELRSLCGL